MATSCGFESHRPHHASPLRATRGAATLDRQGEACPAKLDVSESEDGHSTLAEAGGGCCAGAKEAKAGECPGASAGQAALADYARRSHAGPALTDPSRSCVCR